MRRYLFLRAAVAVFWGCQLLPASAGPVDDVARTPRDRVPAATPQGELTLFPLTADHIAVAGDYNVFLDRRIGAVYRSRLTRAEQLLQAGKLPQWSYRFFTDFATAEVVAEYLPSLRDAYQKPGHFTLRVNGEVVAPARQGYWISAIGTRRLSRLTRPGTEMVSSAELIPFVYLQLPAPLRDGDVFGISGRFGEEAELRYDELKTVSRAIKVNQEGYVPDAGAKYAYLGQWLGGELGPLDTRSFEGREFHLRDAVDGAIRFTGKLRLRAPEQYTRQDEGQTPLNGEIVMEMDFSAFSAVGRYFIHVPGVGRSWEFLIGEDAIGKAFYVQMRGLFHQRSGIAKEPRYTQWSMKRDHPISFRGGFLPNDRHYQGKGGRIVDAQGRQVDVRHFDLVRATATSEALAKVSGGWWDAGDFDRRTYHFEVVDALLSVYLLFPENFADGQLDIPESGNGIPDIVDEAAWGVDVWRRAQNEAGGVGCWLEATSHPINPDPEIDTQPYYLALPTRESTIQYCGHAAKLARAYRQCGRRDLAERFFASAEKAWRFAMDPANTLSTSFVLPKQGRLFYREPDELPEEDVCKAALNLYLYSRREEFQKQVDAMDMKKIVNIVKDRRTPYFLSELEEGRDDFFLAAGEYRKMIRRRADELLKSQRELAYRNINWDMKSGFFLYLAWGEALPFKKGAYLIMAWRIDGAAKYRDAALLCFDWMMGTNPMGRSMTTGLGRVYPVRLLSLPMWAWRDRLVDPIPGLTLYTFDGRSDYSVTNMLFSFNVEERKDHKFPGVNVTMLPDSISGGRTLSRAECYKLVSSSIPVWRRFANLEGYAVGQNEFTVWETMAPAAAAYGALLKPGWLPPPDWKLRSPKKTLKELDGHIFLP